MNHRVLCLCCLLALSLVHAVAQDNGSQLAINGRQASDQLSYFTLSGSVATRDGHAVRDARVEVRPFGNGLAVASGYTMPNGTFEFNNLPRGIYEVVVVAGIREARERVELYQPDAQVRLTLPGETDDRDPLAGNSTISVARMKVPDKARKLYSKAEEAFQKQKASQAREQVDKALKEYPNYAQALCLRGILNLQEDNVDQARTDLEAAIQADGSYAMGYIVLGATYNVARRYDDAVRSLERGIALMPNSWQAYFEMSKAMLAQGNYPAAVRQITKAAEIGPANYAAIHLVKAHALLGLKDYPQAIIELEQFLGTDPNGPDSARARQTLDQVRAFLASNGK